MMSEIKFSKNELQVLIPKIQRYVSEELDKEIGSFDAEFLLNFFSEEVGSYFYNRGLYDAQAALDLRVESIAEAMYELEKPTEFSK
jgi:uncharacterized protein (DUF2164 family)